MQQITNCIMLRDISCGNIKCSSSPNIIIAISSAKWHSIINPNTKSHKPLGTNRKTTRLRVPLQYANQNAGSTMGQRLRRWPIVEPAFRHNIGWGLGCLVDQYLWCGSGASGGPGKGSAKWSRKNISPSPPLSPSTRWHYDRLAGRSNKQQ